MNFKNFIKPYMRPVEVLEKTEGGYVGGIWEPGEEQWVSFSAAIHPLSDDQLIYGEAGTYTNNDHRLFTYRDLKQGQKIKSDESTYTVQSKKDFSFYGKGLQVYIVRREGAAGD